MTPPLRLVGAPGSPYTRKMRALLRYRRIPFQFVIRNSKEDRDTPDVPVALIPILVFPGEGGGAAAGGGSCSIILAISQLMTLSSSAHEQ